MKGNPELRLNQEYLQWYHLMHSKLTAIINLKFTKYMECLTLWVLPTFLISFLIGQYHDSFISWANHDRALIIMHHKLVHETILSHFFIDWFNIWQAILSDQSADSSHKLIWILTNQTISNEIDLLGLHQHIPPHKVKMQYVHFRLHVNYFLLPWKIPEEVSRRSMLFNNYRQYLPNQTYVHATFYHGYG